ncbi:hypothetical protein [Effusibacillus pohliae]|uniref:hypothetical protein n=1 Tax=Effusibacillus pohliae TaxID=232270 RepID=UPI0003A5A903|nr:hypothetical protein [Effusibacillus pohliae]
MGLLYEIAQKIREGKNPPVTGDAMRMLPGVHQAVRQTAGKEAVHDRGARDQNFPGRVSLDSDRPQL